MVRYLRSALARITGAFSTPMADDDVRAELEATRATVTVLESQVAELRAALAAARGPRDLTGAACAA